MEGKEAIINKILSDAEENANEIINSANEFNNNLVSDAEEWAKSYKKSQEEVLKKDQSDIISRRIIVANLDVRKNILAKKRKLIDQAFDLVYKKMCNLDKKSYLSYIEKLLISYSEKNETIILSKDGVLSNDSVNDLEIVKKNKLSVSKYSGDFIGGIKLITEKTEKDLSFRAIINEEKEKRESEISKKIF
ncbi:MAG: V-type ATP synthase subunit E [Clostridia bacterium]|nr:V-type ATP synthase subunit E [Clostridia bacterium]